MKQKEIKPGGKRLLRKRNVILMVVLLAAATAAGFGLYRANAATAAAETLPVMTATVEKGTISTTIEGSGTLGNQSGTDVTVPTGLVMQEVLVSAGDSVEDGDKLATVTQASLQECISQVQEQLDETDTQVAEESESSSKTIAATVSGRVKKIFAQEDADVVSTVLENGALLLLSLDGTLSVDLETSAALTVGDTVNVTLSDGTLVEGTVAKSISGGFTVTVSDDGPAYQDKVTVTTESGDAAGTGSLYITKEWKAIETSGSVSSIAVSENDSVSSGSTLLELGGSFTSASYQSLASQRQTLEGQLNTLLVIAQNGAITAEYAGIITSVNATAGSSVSKQSGETSSTGSSVSSGAQAAASVSKNENAVLVSAKNTVTPEEADNTDTDDTDTDQKNPVTGGEAPSKDDQTGGTSSDETGPDNTQTGGNAADGTGGTDGTTSGGNGDGTQQGGTEDQTSGGASRQSGVSAQSAVAVGSVSGSGGSSASGASVSGSTSSAGSGSAETVGLETAAAFTITSGDEMMLTVNVDELDILSASVGQKVTLTLDAIADKTFEGSITGIDKNGTSSGGVTKYPVEITVARDESMLSGMNASATIVVEELEDVLVVPSEAVKEKGGKSYVYTGQDTEGNLTGETEVETGSTDGSRIEIKSGLSEGDTVCYQIPVSSQQGSSTGTGNSGKSGQGFGTGTRSFDGMPSGGPGGAPSGMGGGNE